MSIQKNWLLNKTKLFFKHYIFYIYFQDTTNTLIICKLTRKVGVTIEFTLLVFVVQYMLQFFTVSLHFVVYCTVYLSNLSCSSADESEAQQ